MLQLMILKEKAKGKVCSFLASKRKGVDGLLVTVGLCVLAIAIIVIFNGRLSTIVEDIFTKMTTKINDILG